MALPPRGPEDEHVVLAVVTRPHGVRGELKVKLFNPDSDVLLRKRRARLVLADGEAREVSLRNPRAVPGGMIVRLDGVDDREAAEALRGARFEVKRADLEPAGDDEFYVVDLIGCRAELHGAPIGEVVAVRDYPTCDVLVVEGAGGCLEIPLLDAYVGDIDLVERRIAIRSLEGLS
jgi:16S rRNA processing protein RimM